MRSLVSLRSTMRIVMVAALVVACGFVALGLRTKTEHPSPAKCSSDRSSMSATTSDQGEAVADQAMEIRASVTDGRTVSPQPVVGEADDDGAPSERPVRGAVIEHRLEVATSDLEFLQARRSGLVPWGHIREWMASGQYEAVALALRDCSAPTLVAKTFGQMQRQRGQHQALQEYLEKFHPDVAQPFVEGIESVESRERQRVRISALDGATDEGRRDLTSIFEDTERPPNIRARALQRLLASAPAGTVERYVQEAMEWIPTSRDLAPLAVSALYFSPDPWCRDLVELYVIDRRPGWQAALDCAWAERNEAALEWLLETRSAIRDERALAAFDRTIDRVALVLEREERDRVNE